MTGLHTVADIFCIQCHSQVSYYANESHDANTQCLEIIFNLIQFPYLQ